ncbi:hypothetical protein Bbelb_094760 [Branchiostoma belcheri]|nr:hypothetical protein Bbelb_094760 [Branchiostoma belcheri]
MPSGLVLLLVIAASLVGCSSCVDLGCCDASGGDPPTTINCTTAGHLRGISTALPDSLKVLVLQYQIIRVIKRPDLPYLPELRLLAIKNSRLAAVHAGSFESVPNVTTLDLSANKIRTLEAGTFAGLQKLRTLNLAVNSIYSVDSGTFVELRELRTLDLSGNCLPRIPGDVWLLQSATEVNLVFNLILRAPLEDLQNFERATEGMTLDGAGKHGNCDCTLREIRYLIKRNKRLHWSIRCTDANGQLRYLSTIPLDSLTCEPPDVSVTPATQAVDAQGRASFTCRAECEEQLHFSWLLPNGEEHPSSYEHSRQYTSARVQQCKGFNVRTYEKQTVCYSVFTVTSSSETDGSDVFGTYTCRVTGEHTHNASASAVLTTRNTQDWTTPQQHTTATPHNPIEGQDTNATTPDNKSTVLVSERTPGESAERPVSVSVYVVVASVIVVCVTLVVVTAVRKVRTRKEKREKNGPTRDVNQTPNNDEDDTRTYENDDQFLSGGDPGNRVVYENNQFSSDETLGRQTYENDNQFPDEEANEQPYENDDQFSNNETLGRQAYENDDQFSNNETFGRQTYENDDQFPNVEANEQPYENDNQFSNDEIFGRTIATYENNDQFSDKEGAGHIYDNNDGLSGRDKITTREKRVRDAYEARPSHQPRRINRRKLRPSMCKITVLQEDIEERHYDNRTPGSCRVTTRFVGSHTDTKVLQHAASQVISFYDNEKPANDIKGTSVFVAKEPSETGFGHYDNEIQSRNKITTRSKNTSQTNKSDYVTRSCIIAAKRKARESAGAKLCDNVAFTASRAHPMGHYDNEGGFIRFAESSQKSAADHDKQQSESLTGCHVRREDSGIRVQKDEQSGDAIETTSANDYIVVGSGEPSEPADYLDIQNTDKNKTNDTSEHDYVTLPNTGDKIDDNSDHHYVTLPNTDKIDDDTSEHNYVTLPNTDKIDDDTSNHEYVTLPNTCDKNDHLNHPYVTFPNTNKTDDTPEHDYVTFPTHNKTDDDTPEHAYVTFPTDNKTDDTSEHDYVTFPTHNKTDDDTSDHEYVTLPSTDDKTDDQFTEHEYVTFPNSS